MRQLHLKVLKNKDLVCTNGAFVLGNKGDNNTTKINITCDETLLQYNNFLILETPAKDHKYCCPLVNMEFLITSTICNLIGEWGVTFLSTSQEDVSDENIDYSQAIMVSNAITGVVNDSVIDDKELETLPVDPNMEVLYNDLMSLRNDLNTLMEDYPQIKDYVEVQETLDEILYKLDHIKIDTSGLVVEVDLTSVLNETQEIKDLINNLEIDVDLSPISSKLDDLSEDVSNIPTNDYTNDIAQIKGQVNSINSMLQMSIISNLNQTVSNTEIIRQDTSRIDNKLGNNDTKADGTLFNYTYWALVRAEEAKSNTVAIMSMLTDVNTLVDEILE